MNPVALMLILGLATTLLAAVVGYLHGRQRRVAWEKVCYPGSALRADHWYWRTLGPNGLYIRVTEEAIAVGEKRERRDTR
jgi:hypothetical protein